MRVYVPKMQSALMEIRIIPYRHIPCCLERYRNSHRPLLKRVEECSKSQPALFWLHTCAASLNQYPLKVAEECSNLQPLLLEVAEECSKSQPLLLEGCGGVQQPPRSAFSIKTTIIEFAKAHSRGSISCSWWMRTFFLPFILLEFYPACASLRE
jgi:hypothetical protein